MGRAPDIERLFQQRSQLAGRNDEFIVTDVPLDRIRPSKANFYGMRDIEALAEDIEMRGLDQNVLLRAPDAEGIHEIIAGERRYQAFRYLYGQGKTQYSRIPSKVRPPEDNLRAEFSLVMNNAMARHLNQKEQAEQAAALKRILEQMKREGYPIPGRVQEYVAQLMHLSSSHTGNLLKVEKDLHPGLKELLGQEEIGIKEARALSNLPQMEQAQVLEAFGTEGPAAVKRAIGREPSRRPDEENVASKKVRIIHGLREISGALRAGETLNFEFVAGYCEEAAEMLEGLVRG